MNEVDVGLTRRAPSGEKKLVSRPPHAAGIRQRVGVALRKAERREALTERELMIVQWISTSGCCHACYERRRVGVVLRRTL
jgi:hypothetical protein